MRNRGFFLEVLQLLKQLELDRLKESFKQQYGSKVEQINHLKRNHVLLLDTDQGPYVLKIYREETSIRWQEKFIEQMQEKKAKGIVPFLKNLNNNCANLVPNTSMVYGVMPYIPGVAINPHHYNQVKNGIKLLSHFHKYGVGIYGKHQMIPFQSNLYKKWKERLEMFEHSIKLLQQGDIRQDGLYKLVGPYANEAIEWARCSLNLMPQAYMLYLEEQAQWERQIAHLDVAPHNFLILNDNHYYLIDYDLVDYSPPLLDVVQFINRILYHYEWSLEVAYQLIEEYKATYPLSLMQQKIFPILLIYPNDLFREWLGVWKNKEGYHPAKVYQYFEEMEKTWNNRRRFVQDCLTVIK